jgi:hypothetical protein
VERPLRFVFFGQSIVSDWNNPSAAFSRALLRALNRLGHETRFLEERANQATVGLLREAGSAPMRDFALDYADIVYRTYELPKGAERTLWLARELGDVDAVVALDDAPPEVIDELARVHLPRLVRALFFTRDTTPPFEADILLSPTTTNVSAADIDEFARSLVERVVTELTMRRHQPPSDGLRRT